MSSDDAAPDDDALSSTTQEVINWMQTPSFTAAPTCSPPHQVSAAPGEEGQWAAARVGATGASGFKPRVVKLYLRGQSAANGTWCAGNVSFKVRIYAGLTYGAPGSTFIAEATVPATAAPDSQDRAVSVNVRAANIAAYRSVYVAVQMVGNPATDTDYNCVAGCGPQTNGLNWWSLEDAPPYDWVSLASVGIGNMDIGIRVEGDVL